VIPVVLAVLITSAVWLAFYRLVWRRGYSQAVEQGRTLMEGAMDRLAKADSLYGEHIALRKEAKELDDLSANLKFDLGKERERVEALSAEVDRCYAVIDNTIAAVVKHYETDHPGVSPAVIVGPPPWPRHL
jgi:uncharacterized membrane protein YccC